MKDPDVSKTALRGAKQNDYEKNPEIDIFFTLYLLVNLRANRPAR
jgi:hypothetical protein